MERSLIDAIKESIDLRDFIPPSNKRKKGKETDKDLCPFHNDTQPSLWIHRDHWYCFGCRKGGDVFDYYMLLHDMTFKEAVEALAREVGFDLSKVEGYKKLRTLRWRRIHREHEKGKQEQGEKTQVRIVKANDLSPVDLEDATAPSGPFAGLTPEFLRWAGVRRNGRSFVVPIERDGNIVSACFYRPGGTPKWKILKEPAELIFNRDLLEEERADVWILEGAKDSLYGMFHGLPCVGILIGAWFKEEWAPLFAKVLVPIVLFDNDDAGRRGAFAVKKAMRRAVILDWNESPWDWTKRKGFDLADFFKSGGTVDMLLEWALEHVPKEAKAAIEAQLANKR